MAVDVAKILIHDSYLHVRGDVALLSRHLLFLTEMLWHLVVATSLIHKRNDVALCCHDLFNSRKRLRVTVVVTDMTWLFVDATSLTHMRVTCHGVPLCCPNILNSRLRDDELLLS